jgi:pimeloyl-ACP methyl ester carboxylesterase
MEPILKDLRARIRRAMAYEPLPKAIEAETRTMRLHRGEELSYYEDRRVHGRPLVLVHSINACASAYEVKPLFDRFRRTRPVFAVDLPGFGLSERDARDYTPELYAECIVDLLTRVKDKGEAPDVLALSLSCEFVARAATTRKDLVHSLIFVSPTGFETQTGPGIWAAVRSLASSPGRQASDHWWALLAFRAIASRVSIRHYLKKSFVGTVDEGLRSYAYATSHQRGAEHAPLAFLRGRLSSPSIRDAYAAIERPVMVLYDRDAYTDFATLPEMVDAHPSWESKRVAPTLGMPQFERLEDVVAALEAFWARQHERHSHHAQPTHA